MTHPLTNWLLDQMLAAGYPATPEEAQRIAAGFVRHPAMRESSEAVMGEWCDCGEPCSIRMRAAHSWRAGCDALARKIEEASR